MGCSSRLMAQQFIHQALFADNLNIYNPAYTGIKDQIEINAGARYQWVGINGSPFSQTVNMHMPIYSLKSGIGLTLTNNQQGLQRNTAAGLNYAYVIRKKKFTMGMGVRAGIIQSYLDGQNIITPTGNYESGNVNHNDPILPIAGVSKIAPDIAAGIVLQSKRAFISLSALYLNEPKLNLTATNSPNLVTHYILGFGKKFILNKRFALSNNYLIKSDMSDNQAEGNLLLDYKQVLKAGVGYRISLFNADAAIAMVSIKLSNKLFASYVYEYPISTLNKITFNSHEILLIYKIDLSTVAKPGKIIYNPRY